MGDVLSLFSDQAPPKASKPKLEIHEHCFIRGPRARFAGADASHLVHSHVGGDVPHSHPDTGPASYTIDKDDWYARTGLQGGGRKKFTSAPTGEQFSTIPRTPEESTFGVIVCDPPAPSGFTGEGGGHHAAARMVLAFGMKADVKPAASTDPEPPNAA
jgi:hypothetical protein